VIRAILAGVAFVAPAIVFFYIVTG